MSRLFETSVFVGTFSMDKRRSWHPSDISAAMEHSCRWYALFFHPKTTQCGHQWQQVQWALLVSAKHKLDYSTSLNPQVNTPKTTTSTETSCSTLRLVGSLTATTPTAPTRLSGGKMPNPSGRQRPNTGRRLEQEFSMDVTRPYSVMFSGRYV